MLASSMRHLMQGHRRFHPLLRGMNRARRQEGSGVGVQRKRTSRPVHGRSMLVDLGHSDCQLSCGCREGEDVRNFCILKRLSWEPSERDEPARPGLPDDSGVIELLVLVVLPSNVRYSYLLQIIGVTIALHPMPSAMSNGT